MTGVKFTIEFTVDQLWIDDGFDIDDEFASDILSHCLSYAYPREIKARVVSKLPVVEE